MRFCICESFCIGKHYGGTAFRWIDLPFVPSPGDELNFPTKHPELMPHPPWLGSIYHISVTIDKRVYVEGCDVIVLLLDGESGDYWPDRSFDEDDVRTWRAAAATCGFEFDDNTDLFEVIDRRVVNGLLGIANAGGHKA